ncbi:MAG: hypothetical protein R2881_11015 [Eubacteriales bacterium]
MGLRACRSGHGAARPGDAGAGVSRRPVDELRKQQDGMIYISSGGRAFSGGSSLPGAAFSISTPPAARSLSVFAGVRPNIKRVSLLEAAFAALCAPAR